MNVLPYSLALIGKRNRNTHFDKNKWELKELKPNNPVMEEIKAQVHTLLVQFFFFLNKRNFHNSSFLKKFTKVK